ncbi:MAG: hypothetical protein AB1458_08545 [Bacteroidota bacterium]
MRTMGLKAILVAGMAAVFAVTGTSPSLAADGSPNSESIKKDIANIERDRAKIAELKQERKDLKRSGDDNKMSLVENKVGLKKAKADLKKDKCYLKADKKALKEDHKMAIREARKAIREDKAELRAAKRGAGKDDNLTAQYEKQLEYDKMLLERSKDEMKSDMEDIRQLVKDARSDDDGYRVIKRRGNR